MSGVTHEMKRDFSTYDVHNLILIQICLDNQSYAGYWTAGKRYVNHPFKWVGIVNSEIPYPGHWNTPDQIQTDTTERCMLLSNMGNDWKWLAEDCDKQYRFICQVEAM